MFSLLISGVINCNNIILKEATDSIELVVLFNSGVFSAWKFVSNNKDNTRQYIPEPESFKTALKGDELGNRQISLYHFNMECFLPPGPSTIYKTWDLIQYNDGKASCSHFNLIYVVTTFFLKIHFNIVVYDIKLMLWQIPFVILRSHY
jgi:hypothetical protein